MADDKDNKDNKEELGAADDQEMHEVNGNPEDYGKSDGDKAATTPLVKHEPAAGGKKGKKGKKGDKKDKLEDLKQELEMIHVALQPVEERDLTVVSS